MKSGVCTEQYAVDAVILASYLACKSFEAMAWKSPAIAHVVDTLYFTCWFNLREGMQHYIYGMLNTLMKMHGKQGTYLLSSMSEQEPCCIVYAYENFM